MVKLHGLTWICFVILSSYTTSTVSVQNLCAGIRDITVIQGEECNSYIVCVVNIVFRKGWCIVGTGYDPYLNRCTWQTYIRCQMNELIRLKEREGVFVCPGKLSEAFYANYTSGCPTTSYIQCNKGVQNQKSCPTGTYYNDGTSACDVVSHISCGVESPQCPQSLGYGVFADYSSGCPPTQYFVCSGYYDTLTQHPISYKTNHTCPKGLYYNEGVQSCDFIQNVPCQHNIKH